MRIGYAQVVLLALAALPLAVGCTAQSPGQPETHPPLLGTSWRLESLSRNGESHAALTSIEVTLVFDRESHVTGNAGCNQYFGAVESDTSGALSFSGLGSTKMFCHEPGVMQQEQDFLNALGAAERYEVRDGLLRISGGNTALVLSPA